MRFSVGTMSKTITTTKIATETATFPFTQLLTAERGTSGKNRVERNSAAAPKPKT